MFEKWKFKLLRLRRANHQHLTTICILFPRYPGLITKSRIFIASYVGLVQHTAFELFRCSSTQFLMNGFLIETHVHTLYKTQWVGVSFLLKITLFITKRKNHLWRTVICRSATLPENSKLNKAYSLQLYRRSKNTPQHKT